ncbi:YbeD family protein [Sediminicurvatus halobius]|uniref:UPF0250 protein DEM34_02940 n=1 Tax=Sediminicurvatus halobius TaxID=2182432 RepID=A0A2U2N820_9GAMM|nr:DUF493 domain-containing protein [Spiribacter halobius]PWG65242.1 DUF493 domain-containing protein [Spiribacter halobius]UEX78802.1 DUF493 domain-containing protein [Spiribacter halobius]
MSDDDSPLDFPCEFPIKAMGRTDADLAALVWRIVSSHAPATPAEALRTTPSRHGRFVSVTVTITAESRAQLDAIYHELQSHGDVLATL